MGRFNPSRDVHEVYDAAFAWSQRCLLRDDSILSDQKFWTKGNVEELVVAFVDTCKRAAWDPITQIRREVTLTPAR
jgi:5-methylcytosine-specific restriction enzyme B